MCEALSRKGKHESLLSYDSKHFTYGWCLFRRKESFWYAAFSVTPLKMIAFSLSFWRASSSVCKRVNQTINQVIHFSSTQREIQ